MLQTSDCLSRFILMLQTSDCLSWFIACCVLSGAPVQNSEPEAEWSAEGLHGELRSWDRAPGRLQRRPPRWRPAVLRRGLAQRSPLMRTSRPQKRTSHCGGVRGKPGLELCVCVSCFRAGSLVLVSPSGEEVSSRAAGDRLWSQVLNQKQLDNLVTSGSVSAHLKL